MHNTLIIIIVVRNHKPFKEKRTTIEKSTNCEHGTYKRYTVMENLEKLSKNLDEE